jgi:hypothetical protein
LPIERGKAILLITDIPARARTNCGEPYLEEETAQEVQEIVNERLSGEVSYPSVANGRPWSQHLAKSSLKQDKEING